MKLLARKLNSFVDWYLEALEWYSEIFWNWTLQTASGLDWWHIGLLSWSPLTSWPDHDVILEGDIHARGEQSCGGMVSWRRFWMGLFDCESTLFVGSDFGVLDLLFWSCAYGPASFSITPGFMIVFRPGGQGTIFGVWKSLHKLCWSWMSLESCIQMLRNPFCNGMFFTRQGCWGIGLVILQLGLRTKFVSLMPLDKLLRSWHDSGVSHTTFRRQSCDGMASGHQFCMELVLCQVEHLWTWLLHHWTCYSEAGVVIVSRLGWAMDEASWSCSGHDMIRESHLHALRGQSCDSMASRRQFCMELVACKLALFVDLGWGALELDRPASQLDSYVQISFVSGLESCHEMILESCIHTHWGGSLAIARVLDANSAWKWVLVFFVLFMDLAFGPLDLWLEAGAAAQLHFQ